MNGMNSSWICLRLVIIWNRNRKNRDIIDVLEMLLVRNKREKREEESRRI